MTTATLFDADLDVGRGPRDLAEPGDERMGHPPFSRGGLTLDELLVSAWEGLRSDHTAACPVCGGVLAPRFGHGHGPVGGRCTSCHTTLS